LPREEERSDKDERKQRPRKRERERAHKREREREREREQKRDSPKVPCPSSCLLGRGEPAGATMASNDVSGDTSHVALRCSLSVHTLRRTTAHYRGIHRRREGREGRRGGRRGTREKKRKRAR